MILGDFVVGKICLEIKNQIYLKQIKKRFKVIIIAIIKIEF